jgi:hypothetical protein
MSLDRRNFIQGFGLAALLPGSTLVSTSALASTGTAESAARAPSAGVVDLHTPEGTVTALAKLSATLDPDGHKHGWYTGVMMAVVPGEAVRELVGVFGMSTQRLLHVPERGGFQLLQKECGFFTDLKTGEILERWHNPYIDETVEPFPIANPAVNRWILPVVRRERFYENVEETVMEDVPFVLPWERVANRVLLEQRIHFWARNPLDPAVWKRESSGTEIQVSDMLSYHARWDELADPNKLTAEYSGHWVHVRPWQPWMLMGNHPGHVLYSAMTCSAPTLADVPDRILSVVRERLPEFLEPPTEPRPSEPSIIRYMREREPV